MDISHPDFDSEYQDTLICPYCGHEWNISDVYDTVRDEDGEAWCDECDKEFDYSMHISHSFSTYKKEKA